MSYDEIRLNYELAEDMAKTFRTGAEVLQDTLQEMQNIANTLADGALLGRGGEAFVEAIRSKLCPSIAKLGEKFQELESDVNEAVNAMREADQQSASQFSG
jgi:WXG100 family type VII secretion target